VFQADPLVLAKFTRALDSTLESWPVSYVTIDVPRNHSRWHLVARDFAQRHIASRDQYVRHAVPGDFGICHLVCGNLAFPL
jgi:hypothetical protein